MFRMNIPGQSVEEQKKEVRKGVRNNVFTFIAIVSLIRAGKIKKNKIFVNFNKMCVLSTTSACCHRCLERNLMRVAKHPTLGGTAAFSYKSLKSSFNLRNNIHVGH